MASLYKRPRSPFWWLRYSLDGTIKRQSTELRIDSETQTAQAQVICAKMTLSESTSRAAAPTYDWSWVSGWLVGHCRSPLTWKVYELHWRHISHWLAFAGIRHPREITYRHGHDYIAWRTGRRAGRKVCSKNTALQEAKFLGLVLRQCAFRGDITLSPIQRLGIAKDEAEPKREFTDDEINRSLAALDEQPEWLRLSFLIGLHTGLRLRETRLNMALVDFDRKTITIESPKGGRGRAFTRPLPEALVPVLAPLRRRKYSHEFPFQPSRRFQHFFHCLEIKNVCFHCLRVTYVTRLHRAGVPLSAAMRLVNHSSSMVHRIYTRLDVDDVREYADIPLFSTSPGNSKGGSDSPRAGNSSPRPSASPSRRKRLARPPAAGS